METEDINRIAWNEEVKRGCYWSRIIAEDEINAARSGTLNAVITPSKPLPDSWTAGTKGKNVLLLAGAGGQQTPLFSAFGANVTTIDQSEGQLNQDRIALKKYNLKAELIQADIRDTGLMPESFDYVINPVSFNFIDNIEDAYSEVHRVLKKDGLFLFGIANPILYAFDPRCQEKKLKIKYTIPFATTKSLSKKQIEKKIQQKDTFEFSHTLDSIIGGLLKKGFVIEDFFSDSADSEPTDSFVYDSYLAFKARKK